MDLQDYEAATRQSPNYDPMTWAWAGVLVGLKLGDEEMIVDSIRYAVDNGPGTPLENHTEIGEWMKTLVRKD